MKKINLMLMCLLPLFANADVSVHVLDTNLGQPGPNIDVSFYHKVGNTWKHVSTQKTDSNGRIKSFDFSPEVKSGQFRAIFHVAPYFKNQKLSSFYEDIPVDFKVADTSQHYHIPLLLSPYAYSTYRGN